MPLNPRNGRDELNRIIDVTAPSVIIFDADCAEKFANTSAHLISARGEHQRADSRIYDLVDDFKGAAPTRHAAHLDHLQAINSPVGQPGCQKVLCKATVCLTPVLHP